MNICGKCTFFRFKHANLRNLLIYRELKERKHTTNIRIHILPMLAAAVVVVVALLLLMVVAVVVMMVVAAVEVLLVADVHVGKVVYVCWPWQ